MKYINPSLLGCHHGSVNKWGVCRFCFIRIIKMGIKAFGYRRPFKGKGQVNPLNNGGAVV